MKKIIFTLILSILFGGPLVASADNHNATLSESLSGRILLQIEEGGEGWYVNPVNNLRYFLGRPADAYEIMRQEGLGISEDDYAKLKNDPPERLMGYILLRVEMNGEAYYVDPVKKELVFLDRPRDAFAIMRERGLGVSNDDLTMMPVSGESSVPPGDILKIFIESPDWNENVDSPISVSGQAKVFEDVVNIRLRDSNDNIIVDTTAMASESVPLVNMYSRYSKSIEFDEPETDSGYLEVFNTSARDGSEINKVIMLLRF